MKLLSLQSALLALATTSLAQQTYVIDPNNVPIKIRQSWCTNQVTQCPLICLQYPGQNSVPRENRCDPQILTYSCVCTTGLQPNISEYSQTLPYYICTEWGTECVANCGSNSQCAADCREKHPCGAQSPKRVNLTTSSAVATATGTGLQLAAAGSETTYSGILGATNTGAAVRIQPIGLELGQFYGFAVLAGGFFAGMALLL